MHRNAANGTEYFHWLKKLSHFLSDNLKAVIIYCIQQGIQQRKHNIV